MRRFQYSFRQLRDRAFFGWLFFALLILPTGCKKSAGTVPVHGSIKYRGEPLAASSVTFFPVTGRPVTVASPEGEYATDLMPGDYTAIVSVGIEYPTGYKEGDPVPMPKVVLPEEYTTRAKSTLKTTVKMGEDEPIDFDLK